ncbi:MAG: hypothetical protein FJX44_10735 [Alphaproteobacteria bacterium]|nr:hypothetical protein [Alphaproteobacteria bacterium]
MSGPKAQNPAGDVRPPDDEQGGRPNVEYIASMLEGLRRLAMDAGRPFLAYLIDIALEEAKSGMRDPK